MDAAIWLGLGLLAGGSVSLIYDENFTATIRNIIFGVVGSIIGGGIITTWDHGRLPTLDFYFYSIIFTAIISVIIIILFRLKYRPTERNFTPIKFNENGRLEKVMTDLMKKKETLTPLST